ncbi:NACHT and Ankyrin domain protein [Aspergillus fijiensis CBS 313.89]|uniref:Ciliary neurotrophic factor n=1 Tax=Aspergillus fijiensis CBS 313.89 TaxID=1448319 RepID=A0A8G1VXD3_9EURO|nr:uncharacterized protein BO72DRAFT_255854 [Aspergillus fijiensis CBS 313.89]RAK72874.1 hypothetical protein BO72DRAFT_255854 [Aspergillus fijiensis CBS 313.89]
MRSGFLALILVQNIKAWGAANIPPKDFTAHPHSQASANAIMVQIATLRAGLTQTTQATRTAMRCLNSGRDSQETSQKALTLLSDILDLLYRIQSQISWGEEKWHVDPARLNSLAEMLGWFDSTVKSIELYFQPGGVNVAYFRKHLLEKTFLPRLEQYKIVMLLAMQPDSESHVTGSRYKVYT